MYDPLRTKTKVVFYSVVVFVLGLGMASGLGWTSPSYAMPTVNEAPQVAAEAVQPALDLSQAFTNLADAVTPAVVRIEARRPAPQTRQQIPEGLRGFFDNPRDRRQPPSQGVVAGGSGFVVSPDGYILTNNHVVAGAQRIVVTLSNGDSFPATVVGTDPSTDTAVIRIRASGLQPAELGSSSDLQVGEDVIAIGHALGLEGGPTVSKGVVSALGRSIAVDPVTTIVDLIQTDSSINPGNSGGPMLSLSGEFVGIATYKIISSKGGIAVEGVGFAVAAKTLREQLPALATGNSLAVLARAPPTPPPAPPPPAQPPNR